MTKQLLNSRESIALLVDLFYIRVKADVLLGPIFNNAENFSWNIHIPIMVDFWETLLLHTAVYKGNTMVKHLELNRRTPLGADHFARWTELFFETLDTYFEGEGVTEAKKKVNAMSSLMQYKIRESSSQTFIQ
ncbi:MAG: group III truncated hemoglobin [Flavitalea sp.]